MALVRAGCTGAEVAAWLGVHANTVNRWAREAGIRRRPNPVAYQPEVRARALELVRGGLYSEQVADALGVGETTVRRWTHQADSDSGPDWADVHPSTLPLDLPEWPDPVDQTVLSVADDGQVTVTTSDGFTATVPNLNRAVDLVRLLDRRVAA